MVLQVKVYANSDYLLANVRDKKVQKSQNCYTDFHLFLETPTLPQTVVEFIYKLFRGRFVLPGVSLYKMFLHPWSNDLGVPHIFGNARTGR